MIVSNISIVWVSILIQGNQGQIQARCAILSLLRACLIKWLFCHPLLGFLHLHNLTLLDV